jgi:hypothetical protein
MKNNLFKNILEKAKKSISFGKSAWKNTWGGPVDIKLKFEERKEK